MSTLLRAYKVELNPMPEQAQKIRQSIGTCRWLYNQYLAKNQERYQLFMEGKLERAETFLSAYDFDKYINHEVKILEEFDWINQCGSKARKQAICHAETAYKRFFNGQSGFPKFKKKSRSDVKLYFPKNNSGDWTVERHRIKIPTLGWVRVKEKGYVPTEHIVKSGTVSQKAGRYYVSVLCDVPLKIIAIAPLSEPIGIDLGLKDFAVCSNGLAIPNINKTTTVRKLEKKLKREQRRLSRKYESLKRRKLIEEGEVTRQNITQQLVKVQRLYQRLINIRTDFINKTVAEVTGQNPRSITIEDLNVSGMMKNRHLSKAIAKQNFYGFRIKLTDKCKMLGIELRIADRWYPSSKLCHICGMVKNDLKLSDRIYHCVCGNYADRDVNASLNLRDTLKYELAY